MAFIVSSDVQARLSDQAFKRLYAKSGGAAVDVDFLALCVSEANSRAAIITGVAFPGGLDAQGGTVDEGIKGLVVDICNGLAAHRHPSASDASGYAVASKAAVDMLKALNRDQDARSITTNAGAPRPRATVNNRTGGEDGITPTNPFGRAASGQDITSY